VLSERVAAAAANGHAIPGGWTAASQTAMRSRLIAGGATVIEQAYATALAGGGYVSREQVYEIGGYPADRVLKGFTRPINRVVKEMRKNGEIPSDAKDPFEPVFDSESGRAVGFRIPPEVVSIG
jgi:hypothetical protein